MRISRAQKTDIDNSMGKEQLTARSLQEVRTLNVTLDKFSLDIQKRGLFGKKFQTIPILQPVSVKFEPGVLNVIMGVSGGGKTSLLNM